ncbi:MAG: hypothetical protein LBP75_06680 [Planctomycetota bacterium]|nr:hypothetical protein [Planctomycetota bacterium]
MASINAIGNPLPPVAITRQERLASANQTPPPEASSPALAAEQQQLNNAAAQEGVARRQRVNELEELRATAMQTRRDNSPLTDALRQRNNPTPSERAEQEYNSPDYGRFDFSAAPMPVSDAMQAMLDTREYRQDQLQAADDRYAAEQQLAASAEAYAANTAPVYNEVNALTAAQTYAATNEPNESFDADALAREQALRGIFGAENIAAPAPNVENLTQAPNAAPVPTSINNDNVSLPANPTTPANISNPASAAAPVNLPAEAGVVGNASARSAAMRNLASGMTLDPTAYVNNVSPVVANSASALIDTQNLQNDYYTFNAMNNSISNIGVQSTGIYNASLDSIRTPGNALNNQRSVDDAVTAITTAVQSVVAQSNQLRSVNAGELTPVNSVLRDLGNTPAPNDPTTAIGLQDLRSDGRASQLNDPELAAQVSTNAARDISAVRNTVETVQGNLLSAASATLEGAVQSAGQLSAGIGQFVGSANGANLNVEPINSREMATAVTGDVIFGFINAPAQTLQAGSANIAPNSATLLAAG